MGKTQSKVVDYRIEVKGGILVQLQKTAYISNDIIQGVLYISLEEPYQGHNLQVCIEGIEETQFTYQISHGTGEDSSTETVFVKGQNNFLNFAIPVYDFAQGSADGVFTLQAGQWQIPFQMVVADKLPSSMSYSLDVYNKCFIKYCITACIISTEANVKPLQGSQDIFIGQQVQTLTKPITQKKITQPVVFYCCTSGNTNIQATLDQTSYSPNENVNVGLDCDFSAYGKTVTQLKVELRGTITMKGDNTDQQKVMVSFIKIKYVKVTESKLKEKVQIPIPIDIPLSSQGKLIKLSYDIVVTPMIKSFCCITQNEPLVINVIINPTKQSIENLNVHKQIEIQAPQNWNPIQLQVSQFNKQQSDLFQKQQQLMLQQQQIIYQQNQDIFTTKKNNSKQINTAQPMVMINQNQSLL